MATLGIGMPGEFHGRRNLAGYSPWGRRESETTERLTAHGIFQVLGLRASVCFHDYSM